MDRRRFLSLAAAAAAIQACSGTARVPGPTASESAAGDLGAIAGQIVSGGPPPDGIPPIEKPRYVSAAEADRIWKPDDVVDGAVLDGTPRAYPRPITVWHEIVSESVGGKPVAITYCPLTGSTVVFSAELAGGGATTFGTSGQLYNSNLVMYDRATRSLWPQLLGVAVRGERKGERLRELPLAVTTTYGRWRRRHPETVVLSRETGHARAYGASPYGDYDTSGQLIFPARPTDDRFHPKKVVVGVRVGDAALAIPKADFAARRVANAEVGGTPVVALYDAELATIRVFDRRIAKGTLSFAVRDGQVVDEQTGSRWDPEGRAVAGELAGAVLTALSAYDVMWFAHYAFNPGTQVLA